MTEEFEDSNSHQSIVSDDDVADNFKLDRKKIQKATLIDESEELNELGLSIFNQTDFEQGDEFFKSTVLLNSNESVFIQV